MVPGRLLPLAPAELLHQRDRPIPHGRPRAVGRDVRRPGRWDDDRRTPRPSRFVDGDRVRLEFPILSLNPRLRQRCVAPDVWPTLSRA